MSTTANRKVSIGEFINNTAVKFNVDGEILPSVFPRSRIPVQFDQKVTNFWSAPPTCVSVSVYSLGVSAEGGVGAGSKGRVLTGQLVYKENSRGKVKLLTRR